MKVTPIMPKMAGKPPMSSPRVTKAVVATTTGPKPAQAAANAPHPMNTGAAFGTHPSIQQASTVPNSGTMGGL